MRFLTRSREQAIRADERERVLDEAEAMAEAQGNDPEPQPQKAHHAEILSNYERAVAALARADEAADAAQRHMIDCTETRQRAETARRAAAARLRAVAEGRV